MIVAVCGTFLLLVVALLGRWRRSIELTVDHATELTPKTRIEGQPIRRTIFPVAVGVLLLWVVGAHFCLPLSLAYLDTSNARVAAFNVQHLHQSRQVSGEYILIIEGSSLTNHGVDGAALEQSLRASGFPVTVLQLSLSGANHLERLQLLQNFASALSPSDWQRLRQSRLILAHEVQALYDRDPLLNYWNNSFTAQTLGYSNPSNLPILLDWLAHRYDFRELWNRRSYLHLAAIQFLYNALRISYLQRLDAADSVSPVAGFDPAPKRPDFHPPGLLPLDFPQQWNLAGRQAYDRVTYWNTARDAAFRSVFNGRVQSELFFSFPGWLSYEFNYDNWWSSAHPAQLFFNGNKPEVRERLRDPGFWNDPGHLTSSGAEIYTEELTEFLKKHWAAQPG